MGYDLLGVTLGIFVAFVVMPMILMFITAVLVEFGMKHNSKFRLMMYEAVKHRKGRSR